MNLEELQIKIGIELKELNKQLKKASDDINEYIGPKATKKMMSDNNKAIKRGLDEISRTTKYSMKKLHKDTTKEVDDMSKDIHKSLTKAFDIDKTMVKFNKDIDRSMEQAKRSVKSACNDIRKELNAALNVKANIRVSSSTSVSRQNSGSRSDTAAILASSQYTAAMIVKAINAMIDTNNKNTTRLENTINKCTDRIIAALNKSNKKDKTENKSKKVKENKVKPTTKGQEQPHVNKVAKTHQKEKSQTTTKGQLIGQPYGPDYKPLIDALKNAYRTINILNRNLSALNSLKNIKQLGTGSYGANQLQGGTVNFDTIGATKGALKEVTELMREIHKLSRMSLIDSANFDTIGSVKNSLTDVVELMKKIHSLRKGIPSDTTSFTFGEVITPKVNNALTQYGKVRDIIEDVPFRVLDFESGLMNTSNFELGKSGILDSSQVEALKQVYELKKKINSTPLGLNAPMDVSSQLQDLNTYGQRVGAIMGNIGEVYKKLNDGSMLLTSAKKCIDFNASAVFDLIESLNKIENSDAFAHLSQDAQQHLKAMKMALIGCSDALFDLNEQVIIDFNARGKDPKARGLSTRKQKPQRPEGFTPKQGIPGQLGVDIKVNDDAAKKLESIKERISDIRQEFDFIAMEEIPNFAIDENLFKEQFGSIEEYASDLYDLYESLQKLDDERIKLDIDTEDAKKQIKELQEIIATYIDSISNGEFKDNIKAALNTQEKTPGTKQPGKNKKPPKPTIMGFGLGAYKNELEMLGNLAKKVGAKIKKALSTAFHPIAGPDKLDAVLTRIEKKVISVFNKIKSVLSKIFTPLVNVFSKIVGPIINVFSKVVVFAKNMGHKIANAFRIGMYEAAALVRNYGFIIKTHLNKIFTGIKSTKLYTSIASGLNKAKSAVSKFAGKVKPILNKAFTGIKVGAKFASTIGKGLNKAKSMLTKFASSCKTIWGKIRGIFSKGAGDAAKATGKLTAGLKALLAQALGFFSLYALINLGKQAITQSGMLAQSEAKLTALMKQRMGATNETVRAIRELAREQAKLGVVSESAMVRGAEQLSMYVHSAKALETLMPAIANLTARRGGFNATEDDAMEMATQLGEAIREGTTTPLEQSGIYLSEAEIKKFQALRTEEERAAYLANVIAKNVGNINEALANTPHGQIAQLKNNFKSLLGTLGTLLVNVIQPIVKWLNVVVVAANNALKALGELLGFDMTGGGLSGVDLGTGSTGTPVDTSGVDGATDSLDNAKDSAEEAEKAVEKFKGSLMGFDEINILSNNMNDDKDSDSGSEELDPTDITPGDAGQLIPTEMTEGDSIFSKFGEKMKAFMDEILEPFKNAWALLGERWKAEWADLVESFKHFCDSLASFLKSVWDHGGKEFVQHMAEIGLACGIAAMEIGGEILDSLARLWDHLDPANNKHTQGFLDALNETSVKLRDFILGLGDHFESLMANGGQDVLNALGDCFMDLGNAAVTGLGIAIDAIDGLIDHLDPANNEITRSMLKSWEDAFHAVGQCALDFVDFLDSVLKNGGQEVINALGDAFVSLVDLVGDVVKEVSEAFSGLFKHLDPATNQFTKDFLKAWEDAFNEISDMFNSLGDLFGSVMDNGGQELLNSVGDLGMKLGEAFGVIVEEVAKTLKELFEHMDPSTNPYTKKMLESLDGLVDSITGFVDACIKAFQKFMDNGGREVFKHLGDILAIVIDLAATLGSGLIDIITSFMNSWVGQALIEGVAKALAWVAEKLTGLADAFEIAKDIVGNIIDIIVGIFEGDGEKVGKAFANLIKNAFKLTGELLLWLGDVALDLVEGLVKGICALPGLLWEAVKFLFDTIVGFFKELFGIHSPSTVFAELGGFLIEGLVEGILGLVKSVTDAFGKIGEVIFGAIKDIAKTASEKFKDIKDGIQEKLKETKEVVSEKWKDIKETVSDKVKEAYEAAKENWKNIKETTTDKCKEIYEVVKDKYTSIRDTVKDRASKMYDDVSNSWTKMKDDAAKKLEQIRTDAEKKYDQVKSSLVKKIGEVKTETINKWNEVKTSTIEGIEKVRAEAETKYNSIKETMSKKLEEIKSTTSSKWEEIKKDTADKVEALRTTAEEKYQSLKEKLLTKLEDTKSSMGDKWDTIKTEAIKKCGEISTEANDKFGDIKSKFSSKMDEVKSTLNDKWELLKTQASTGGSNIVSSFQTSISNIGSNLGTVFNNLRQAISDKISDIGKLFTNANWTMKPSIKLPRIKIDNYTELFNGLVKVPKFKVEWYKRGGIIDGITPLGLANGALQMGGEAGKEMVVPLENTSFTSKIAQAMGQAVDNALARSYNNNNNNNNAPYVNDSRDVVLQVDGREFARASINSINKLQRESGRTLLDI